jgi:hypothetical protein
MAELKIGPPRPSFKDANTNQADPTPDFGPDFTRTPEKEPPVTPPKVNQKNPPKPASTVFGKLGTNKKLRSPVRKLTREPGKDGELSDLERLIGWYHALSNGSKMFHPKLSMALADQAEECAYAWFDLAEKNDSVRRFLLGCIEGGAWGKVIAAHSPIFMAVLPEKVLERFLLRGMGAFAANLRQESEE